MHSCFLSTLLTLPFNLNFEIILSQRKWLAKFYRVGRAGTVTCCCVGVSFSSFFCRPQNLIEQLKAPHLTTCEVGSDPVVTKYCGSGLYRDVF